MNNDPRYYFKTDSLEKTKILFMSLLLTAMSIPAVYAYSYNLKLDPSQIEPPQNIEQPNPEDKTLFFGFDPHPPEKLFSIPRVIEVAAADPTHLLWFTYPASVRGRVFFGFSADRFPSITGGGGGGW